MRLPSPLPPSLAPLAQRELTVEGQRIAYTEAGSGPTVLLLHGAVFSGNPFWWETQAALAGEYHTVAPDFVGWGASDKPAGPYEVERYHHFLLGFLDALGLARTTVVGHSMGGLIGSSFAVTYPERISGLAAVAVPPAWVNVRIPAQFDRFLTPVLGETLLAAAPFLGPDFALGMRGFYESLFHEPSRHSVSLRDVLAGCCDTLADARHQRAFLDTFRRNQQRLGEHARLAEAVSHTRFPVLIVAGRHDPLFPLPLVCEGARLHPSATLAILDDCAHFPMWEQPEEFYGHLRPFLQAASASQNG